MPIMDKFLGKSGSSGQTKVLPLHTDRPRANCATPPNPTMSNLNPHTSFYLSYLGEVPKAEGVSPSPLSLSLPRLDPKFAWNMFVTIFCEIVSNAPEDNKLLMKQFQQLHSATQSKIHACFLVRVQFD